LLFISSATIILIKSNILDGLIKIGEKTLKKVYGVQDSLLRPRCPKSVTIGWRIFGVFMKIKAEADLKM